ncbi:Glutathione transferase GST 23 [Ananas comosus]|uniref:glutathione transferase n=1 Tax=Ananas comosus TaxID=4615 RepID=A0A199VGH1_ANACO|nr:Glutathione transferase GST 23 [Ananas comosus]
MVKESKVRLFGMWASPAVRRVEWALKKKGIEYEYVEEDLSNKSASLLEFNPINKQVPVLVHDGRPIVESLVIIEYIDETWKDRPLLPKDPYERAKARVWATFTEDKCRDAARKAFFAEGEDRAKAIENLEAVLRVLENEIKGKRFFGGDGIGYTDLVVGWLAFWLGIAEEIACFNVVNAKRFPGIASWIDNFLEDPVINANLPPRDKAVEFFRNYRRHIPTDIYIQQQHLKEAMATGEVKLLGTWSSPFVLRIKWALGMKGAQYEFIEEDLSNKSPMLLQYNPVYKKVPVLVHDGKPITESLVILEYIDEMWKENPILPKDPYEKAVARFLSNFGDSKCLPSIWQVCISTGEKQQEAITSAAENLNILEEKLEGKRFFGGETIGYADISLGWISYMVSLLDDVTNVKLIDEVTYPLLSQWISNFTSSPLINDSLPPRDRMVSKFRMLREAFLASAATA